MIVHRFWKYEDISINLGALLLHPTWFDIYVFWNSTQIVCNLLLWYSSSIVHITCLTIVYVSGIRPAFNYYKTTSIMPRLSMELLCAAQCIWIVCKCKCTQNEHIILQTRFLMKSFNKRTITLNHGWKELWFNHSSTTSLTAMQVNHFYGLILLWHTYDDSTLCFTLILHIQLFNNPNINQMLCSWVLN